MYGRVVVGVVVLVLVLVELLRVVTRDSLILPLDLVVYFLPSLLLLV